MSKKLNVHIWIERLATYEEMNEFLLEKMGELQGASDARVVSISYTVDHEDPTDRPYGIVIVYSIEGQG